MKQKGNTNWLIVLLVFFGAGVLLVVFYSDSDIDWNERYKPDEKMPYDTYLIEQLLRNNASSVPFYSIQDSTHLYLTDTAQNQLLVFIGNTFFYNEKDLSAMLDFIDSGNTVFLAAEDLDKALLDSLYLDTKIPVLHLDEEVYQEEMVNYPVFEESVFSHDFQSQNIQMRLSRSSKEAQLCYVYDFDTLATTWLYFNESWMSYYPSGQMVTLGTFVSKGALPTAKAFVNFIEINYGKGKLYLHLQPRIFTNYFLKERNTFDYVSSVFKDIKPSKIWWAEENRKFDFIKTEDPDSYNQAPDESFMEFILSERALRNGWYFMLFGVLLYLLFGAKRKQRIIPLQEKKDNTSIEYAEVISQLFLEQKDHSKLILMKKELFKHYVRDRYGVKIPSTRKELTEPLLRLLETRSGIASQELIVLFDLWFHIEAIGPVYTSEMLTFHNRLETFYKNSK